MSFILLGRDVQEVICSKALKTISWGCWEWGKVDVPQKLDVARSGALEQVVSPFQVSEGGKPDSRYSLSLAEAG
jgi:hypothetical protein